MKAELLYHKKIDKAAWDGLADASREGSVFLKSWYIHTLQPDWWGICVYDGGELAAIMPLMLKSKILIQYSLQPVLAKYWGVAFASKAHKSTYDKYNWKKKVLEAIIVVLPKLKIFGHNFHPAFDYALPFAWEGYNLQTRYTFQIDLKEDYRQIESNFLYKVRSAIRKAGEEGISIHENTSAEEFLRIVKLNQASGKAVMPVNENEGLSKLFDSAHNNKAAFSLSARLGNETIASSFFVYDEKVTYCLLVVLHPDHKDRHAIQLLISEAIKKAQLNTQTFDFLGVSMRNLEFFFRRFGPTPVPYIFISRNKIPIIKII